METTQWHTYGGMMLDSYLQSIPYWILLKTATHTAANPALGPCWNGGEDHTLCKCTKPHDNNRIKENKKEATGGCYVCTAQYNLVPPTRLPLWSCDLGYYQKKWHETKYHLCQQTVCQPMERPYETQFQLGGNH